MIEILVFYVFGVQSYEKKRKVSKEWQKSCAHTTFFIIYFVILHAIN